MNHVHACLKCGDVFEHDTPAPLPDPEEDHAAWDKAHRCANGHLCTIKYDRHVAQGIAETCKAGGDTIAYIKEHDHDAYLTRTIFGD